VFLAVPYWCGIVVVVLDILVIGDVVVDATVPRLRNVLLTLGVTLFFISAIDTLLNYCPSEIQVGQLSFLDRARCTDAGHDTSEGEEHVVEVSRMVDC
jgi:hypothetical protein